MPARRDDHQQPTIALLDGRGGPLGVVVAESAAHLWLEVQDALRRQRATRGAMQETSVATPVDFAAAMRLVEAEVYDAV